MWCDNCILFVEIFRFRTVLVIVYGGGGAVCLLNSSEALTAAAISFLSKNVACPKVGAKIEGTNILCLPDKLT